MKTISSFLITILLASFTIPGCTHHENTIYGTWQFNKKKSTDIVTWRYRQPQLIIRKESKSISVVYRWLERKKVAMVDSIRFNPGSSPVKIPVTTPFWLENWYMGVLAKTGSDKTITGSWKKPFRELEVQTEQTVETSQGDTQIKTTFTYNLDKHGDILTVTEKRSSRPTPIKLIFERVDAN